MSKFFNVVTSKTITGTTNKKIHHKVGVIKVTENQGWYLHLYHQPNAEYQIFASHNDVLPVIDYGKDEA